LAKAKLQFKTECRRFLVATVSKIVEGSPLKYKLARAILCFVHGAITQIRSTSEKRFGNFIQIIYDGGWVLSVVADQAKPQFLKLCFKAADEWAELFKNFDWNEDRLDVFYKKILAKTEEFKELWSICQLALLLCHGNASVESGYSVNSSILVENLQEESLIAHRRVYDSIIAKGGICNIDVSSKMIGYVTQSCSRYFQGLKRKKEEISDEEEQVKERKMVTNRIKKYKDQRFKITQNLSKEINTIDRNLLDLEMSKICNTHRVPSNNFLTQDAYSNCPLCR
jgi:hypothetical protein